MLTDWFKGITKRNAAERMWQWPTRRWLEQDRQTILDSMPTFIQKIKAAGYSEFTLKDYREILNHAHSNNLEKLKKLLITDSENLTVIDSGE